MKKENINKQAIELIQSKMKGRRENPHFYASVFQSEAMGITATGDQSEEAMNRKSVLHAAANILHEAFDYGKLEVETINRILNHYIKEVS